MKKGGPKPVGVQGIRIGQGQPLAIIAGPCVIESEQSAIFHADKLMSISKKAGVPLIFKASYDKANRTSVDSFRGVGIDKGLKILDKIKTKIGCPVLSDVHTADEVRSASQVLDVLQIPAFLCRQTDLLVEAGKSGKTVNIKKGQFVAPEDMIHAVKKVHSTGNKNILLTERGSSFGYRTLVNDFRAIVLMRELGCPVVFDATHSVQRPGGLGDKSGGDSRLAPYLARAAAAIGADAIFMEVHRDPAKALSDGPNSLRLNTLPELFRKLKKVSEISCRVD